MYMYIHINANFQIIFLDLSLGSTDFGESDGEDDTPVLRRLESELMSAGGGTAEMGGDLFSEIHLNELRKLEKKLEEVCNCHYHIT